MNILMRQKLCRRCQEGRFYRLQYSLAIRCASAMDGGLRCPVSDNSDCGRVPHRLWRVIDKLESTFNLGAPGVAVTFLQNDGNVPYIVMQGGGKLPRTNLLQHPWQLVPRFPVATAGLGDRIITTRYCTYCILHGWSLPIHILIAARSDTS